MDYGQGPFVEGERTVRAQVLACARGACLTPEFELQALTEVVDDMPRWDRVYQALPRRVVGLLGKLRGVAFEGFDWTLREIERYVDGISDGKQAQPTQPYDCMGADKFYAEWPDGDWRAWERHAVVPVLWREVGSTAEQEPAAEPPPVMRVLPPVEEAPPAGPPPAPASTSPPAQSSGSGTPPKSPAPASETSASSGAPATASPSRSSTSGDRPPAAAAPPRCPSTPTREQLERAPAKRALASGTCCLCGKPYAFEELVKEVQGHAAHFHCCKTASPPAKGLHVGERIRELRKAAGLTQAELARQLGIKPSQISEVERGKAELDKDQLGEVASYLGVTTLDVTDAGAPLPKVLEHPAAGRGEPEPDAPAEAPPEDRDVKPVNVTEPDLGWAEDLVDRDAGLDW